MSGVTDDTQLNPHFRGLASTHQAATLLYLMANINKNWTLQTARTWYESSEIASLKNVASQGLGTFILFWINHAANMTNSAEELSTDYTESYSVQETY